MCQKVPKLAKITWNIIFRHFSNISTSCNLVMNMFSGSTNLWGLLIVFLSFNALYLCYKGLLSDSYGRKIGQNYIKYEFWSLSEHFHFTEVRNEYFFDITNLWRLLRRIWTLISKNLQNRANFSKIVHFWAIFPGKTNPHLKTTKDNAVIYTNFEHILYTSTSQKLQHFLAVLIIGNF